MLSTAKHLQLLFPNFRIDGDTTTIARGNAGSRYVLVRRTNSEADLVVVLAPTSILGPQRDHGAVKVAASESV